jgi:hypothetical protein
MWRQLQQLQALARHHLQRPHSLRDRDLPPRQGTFWNAAREHISAEHAPLAVSAFAEHADVLAGQHVPLISRCRSTCKCSHAPS